MSNFKHKVKKAVKWGKKQYASYKAGQVKRQEARIESRERSTKELKSQASYERAQNELARLRSERRKYNAPSGGMGGGSDIGSIMFGGGSGGMGGADVNAVLFGGGSSASGSVIKKKKYRYTTTRVPIKRRMKVRYKPRMKYRVIKKRVMVKQKAAPMPVKEPGIIELM